MIGLILRAGEDVVVFDLSSRARNRWDVKDWSNIDPSTYNASKSMPILCNFIKNYENYIIVYIRALYSHIGRFVKSLEVMSRQMRSISSSANPIQRNRATTKTRKHGPTQTRTPTAQIKQRQINGKYGWQQKNIVSSVSNIFFNHFIINTFAFEFRKSSSSLGSPFLHVDIWPNKIDRLCSNFFDRFVLHRSH